MLLVVEVCVWREVEVVEVGNVASLCSTREFVWDDVDPHAVSWTQASPMTAQL